MTDTNKPKTIQQNFQALFYRREGKELLGKNYWNFWILVIILFITFTAIGFANGSLDYLSQKMSDPFVNWVSIEVPYGRADEIQTLQTDLNEDDVRKTYHYKNITSYNTYPLEIWNYKKDRALNISGRTLSQEDTLLHAILGKKNFVQGEKNFKGEMDIGMIVTAEFLENFGYPKDAPYILKTAFADSVSYVRDSLGDVMDSVRHKGARFLFPIPIRSVVKDLPGLSKLAFTPYFYKQVIWRSHDNPFNPIFTQNILFFTEDSLDALQLSKALKSSLKKMNRRPEVYVDPLSQSDNFSSYKKGFRLEVLLKEEEREDFDFKNNLHQLLVESEEVKALEGRFIRFYDYTKLGKNSSSPAPMDYISINFVKLDNVRDFKDYLYDKSKLKIDMAKVEALENYNFITKLTYAISFVLIIFSIISICLFVSNLLQNHLKSISMNIGTFKAFGLANGVLKSIYLKMIAAIFFGAMLLGFSISFIYGQIGGVRFLVNLFVEKTSEEHLYFQIFDYSTLYASIVLITILYFVIKRTTNKILDKSPGDLIYGRD
ncbi:MAG: ABC transporter permease [Chitinophagales bacterium]